MSILTRDDGAQFVLRSYRELIAQKNTALIKNELRLLAQANGQFVRINKHSGGYLEAAFAKDPGYLFGETVWQHFSRQKNILYCEALDQRNFVLVVVKDGTIHIDAQFRQQELIQELSSLVTENIHYNVYSHGDVPLTIIEESGKIYLTQSNISTYTVLETSLINQLILYPELKLVDIEHAILAAQLNKRPLWLMLTVVVVALVFAWLMWPAPSSVPQGQQTDLSGLKQLQAALASPNPNDQISQLVTNTTATLGILGWQATQIKFADNKITLQLHSLGGSVETLLQWAQTHGITMQLTSTGAEFIVPYVNKTQAAKSLANTTQTLAHIIDTMMQIIPEKTVTIGRSSAQILFKETQFHINVNQVSPDVILLIAKALADQPVTMQNASLMINNGMYSGSFNFIVLGNKI